MHVPAMASRQLPAAPVYYELVVPLGTCQMSNITASASGPLLGVKILDLTQYQVRRLPHPHPACAR